MTSRDRALNYFMNCYYRLRYLDWNYFTDRTIRHLAIITEGCISRSVNNVKSKMFRKFLQCLWCAMWDLSCEIKTRSMEEPIEDHRVIPGECWALKYESEMTSVICARSCNGSFPGFRTVFSGSEIPLRRSSEGNCKGKVAVDTSELYFYNVQSLI